MTEQNRHIPTWDEFLSGHSLYEGWAFGEFALPAVDDAERHQIQTEFEEHFRRTQEKLNPSDPSSSSSLPSSSSVLSPVHSSSSDASLSSATPLAWDWTDGLVLASEASAVIVRDSFTQCFTHRETRSWNWNPYLAVAWVMGWLFRYLLLLPLRLLGLLLGSLAFLAGFGCVFSFLRQGPLRERLLRRLLQFWCSVFIMSWSGVVQYHGEVPKRAANQIYVSNHTSMIDIIVLIQTACFAIVGQQHGGWVGWVQQHVLGPLGGLWFNRTQANDRVRVSTAIKEHIADVRNNPLLLFPEGTCVNNEYSVMFKKGAFELGAVVCPIAIKYDREWADAFWNSRRDPFWRHLVHLMCGWAVVCNVYFLKPMTQHPKESSAGFAQRVKDKICRKIGLRDVPWDGYLKHVQLKEGFKELRQQVYAKQLLNRFAQQSNLTNQDVPAPQGSDNPPPPFIRRINSLQQFRPEHSDDDDDDHDHPHHHHQHHHHQDVNTPRIRSNRSYGNFAQISKKNV